MESELGHRVSSFVLVSILLLRIVGVGLAAAALAGRNWRTHARSARRVVVLRTLSQKKEAVIVCDSAASGPARSLSSLSSWRSGDGVGLRGGDSLAPQRGGKEEATAVASAVTAAALAAAAKAFVYIALRDRVYPGRVIAAGGPADGRRRCSGGCGVENDVSAARQ